MSKLTQLTNFKNKGTRANIGDWGHEYIRQLENEIIDEWLPEAVPDLLPLVKDIICFDCTHHAEIQACDLLMEIDRLELISDHVDKSTYDRICLYLSSCAKHVDEIEAGKIIKIVADQYLKFGEYAKAMVIFLREGETKMVKKVFKLCKDQ